jgi:hypothetical protein
MEGSTVDNWDILGNKNNFDLDILENFLCSIRQQLWKPQLESEEDARASPVTRHFSLGPASQRLHSLRAPTSEIPLAMTLGEMCVAMGFKSVLDMWFFFEGA